MQHRRASEKLNGTGVIVCFHTHLFTEDFWNSLKHFCEHSEWPRFSNEVTFVALPGLAQLHSGAPLNVPVSVKITLGC